MFKNIKWLRLVPDRPGRGGSKTGLHTFQQTPINDMFSVSGAHVYRGTWRRDFDSIAESNATGVEMGSESPLAIHGYVYPSLTDPAAAPGVAILSHQGFFGGGVKHVWDATNNVVRAVRTTNSQQAGIFQNISGRCFFGDGIAEGMIFDNRTPAIHAQLNQNIGIETPQQTLPSSFPSGITPYGTGYSYNGSHYINHPDPNNQIGTILAADTISLNSPNTTYGQYSGVFIVQASPSADAVTSNTSTFTATGTVSITTGQSLVTLAGATWPAGFQYCGLAINFNGYSFVIAEHGVNATAYTIDGNATALSNVQLLILGVYDGPTLTNVPYTITGCQFLMPGAASSVKMVNTGTLGYSQTTQSNLVQTRVLALRSTGYFRNLGNISLGPESANESTGGSIQTIVDAAMPDGKKLLSSASNPFTLEDVGSPMFVDGAGSGALVLASTIITFVDAASVRLADPNISGGAIIGAKAWWGSLPIIADAVMDNNVTFDLTSASNPFVPGDVGQPIVVEDGAPGPTALITTIATYVNAGKVTLALKNTSGGAISSKRAWWRAISTVTHVGPTYAYAWYDPETGHASNISPMYQIPRPTTIGAFTDFANITPAFEVDPGFISYPSGASSTAVNAGTDGARFSHIIFFRTLSTPGSATLYPIGSLMPYVGKVHPGGNSTRGSWSPSTYKGWMGIPNNYVDAPPQVPANQNVWYDFSSDSDLLLAGGFRAPQYTNSKPIALLRGGATQPGRPYAMAYWDRRTWLVNSQEPDKIVFSCDEAQCPLGVPTESFPPTNFLRLPSVDGKVVGMRTVGDMLLVTTQRWAYIIAGNNESNYRLLKVSASMPGVGTYQMDEFPTLTGAEGEPATLFYLGQDRIVYQWTIGNQATPISMPIQNQLDAKLSQGSSSLGVYQNSRVHCISAWGRRLVVVEPLAALGVTFLIYDIDNQVWTSSSPTDGTSGFPLFGGIVPMTTVYGLGVPVNEIYALYTTNSPPGVAVVYRSWIRDDVAVSTALLDMATFPLNFDGKKTRKQLVSVNIHATSGTYSLIVHPNESALNSTPQVPFTAYPDPLDSVYGAPPLAPLDGFGSQDSVIMTAQFYGDSMPLIGYRFVLYIRRTDALPCTIYALDVAYVDVEEPGDGDA